MKELMNEWRNFIKNDILNEDVMSTVFKSTEVLSLLGDNSIKLAENNLVNAFVKAGAADVNAKQYVEAIRFAIVEAIPNIVDLAAASKPALTKYIVGTLNAMVSKVPGLLPILKGLGRISVPAAIIGAIKDVYDIQQAWSAYAKTAGLSNVMATNRLGQLREIEERIKKEGLEAVKKDLAGTALKEMDIFNLFKVAYKMDPYVATHFPESFKLLKPADQKVFIS
jgi:hypothetical protein